MVNKKKSLNIFYIFSLVLLFVLLLGSFSNCFAITTSDIESALTQFKENYPTDGWNYNTVMNNIGNDLSSLSQTIYNLYDGDTYINVSNANTVSVWVMAERNGNALVRFCLADVDYNTSRIFKSSSELVYGSSYNSAGRVETLYIYNGAIQNNTVSHEFRFFSRTSGTNYWYFLMLFPITDTYNNFSDTESSTLNQIFNYSNFTGVKANFGPTNTIELISSSGRKFTFNDFNQLRVNLSGEWSIDDFTFYVQRYIDNQWENFTEPWDYTRIVGYTDPYYIRWNNLNYFPSGTYRYCADYGSLGTDLYYSNSFEITSSSVVNPIVGNNGDVSGSVDTGNTVDDIKDYFGSPADFSDVLSQEDIDNALDLDFISNPYENFILSFFNGLVSSFTDDASDLTFRVHTWGELRTVKVADVTPNYNSDLRVFLTIFSTIVWGFVIIKWVSNIIDGLTHMSLQDSIDLIDAHYSDLF